MSLSHSEFYFEIVFDVFDEGGPDVDVGEEFGGDGDEDDSEEGAPDVGGVVDVISSAAVEVGGKN